MKLFPVLDLTRPDIVLGNHSIWLPAEQIKVPFQWQGRAVKRTHRGEASTPIWDTLADEIAILRALADAGMAPPIGDEVFYHAVRHSPEEVDHAGAWGYEMADARRLKPGCFSVEAMRALPIEGSPGAWNDISVPGRDNVVNGYLIDVRRSAHDMMRWRGTKWRRPDAA